MSIESFSSKDPAAMETFTIDITNHVNIAETIVSASAAISLKSGPDTATDFSPMLSGSTTFLGNKVSQSVTAGVNGCYYYIKYTVVTTQQRLVITCIIPVSIGA